MDKNQIHAIVEAQRSYFNAGQTLSVEKRIGYLKKLREHIIAHELQINGALFDDLGKSGYEAYMTEVAVVVSEVNFMLKHLHSFAKDRTVPTPFGQQLARSYVKAKPYGVTLVMSPWNYPFMLTLPPVIAAVAAGNTVVVKPSAYSPRTSALIEKMLGDIFPPEHVAVITGGREENAALLDEKFDYIFFTGSKKVGQLVLEKAAVSLTPVTLELGGKSPVIVDETAKLRLAARRLVFGKGTNVGQTCVAPDYVFIHRSVKDAFLRLMKEEIARQYGDCLHNPFWGKIVNEKHFDRVAGLIDPEKVVFGGRSDPATRKIELTLMDNVTWEDKVMREEIFGPVLPFMVYDSLDDVIDQIRAHDKPLAMYVFSESKTNIKKLHDSVSFGGGCVNETLIHVISSAMGFGGVGESGMGQYHGKAGFDTFTHYTSIVDKVTWFDLDQRYQPYNIVNMLLTRNFNFGSSIYGKLKETVDVPLVQIKHLLPKIYFRK